VGTFNQTLTRVRRFLRDPDGDIWSDVDIVRYWNDAQHELAQKAAILERVSCFKWPPEFDYSFTHDWEKTYAEGTRYRCMNLWEAQGWTVCYPWEPGAALTSSTTGDDGYRFTHPFEGAAYVSPADYVPAPLNENFYKTKFCAYDNEPIDPVGQTELSADDPFYRTRSGSPEAFWRPDLYGNLMVLYPRPSSVVWQDWSPDDTFSDTLGEGIVAWSEGELDQIDEGIITDAIDSDDAIFHVYEILPLDINPDDPGSWGDQLDWPEWMIHWVECATLERAFGADSDGFIPSLREYWKMRKQSGINAITLFKRLREADREFVYGGTKRAGKSRLRLPSGYPAI
jgi:hypothetical protein